MLTCWRHIAGILRMYETKLKEANPGAKGVSYDYISLCHYIDDMVRWQQSKYKMHFSRSVSFN